MFDGDLMDGERILEWLTSQVGDLLPVSWDSIQGNGIVGFVDIVGFLGFVGLRFIASFLGFNPRQ